MSVGKEEVPKSETAWSFVWCGVGTEGGKDRLPVVLVPRLFLVTWGVDDS